MVHYCQRIYLGGYINGGQIFVFKSGDSCFHDFVYLRYRGIMRTVSSLIQVGGPELCMIIAYPVCRWYYVDLSLHAWPGYWNYWNARTFAVMTRKSDLRRPVSSPGDTLITESLPGIGLLVVTGIVITFQGTFSSTWVWGFTTITSRI